VLCSNCGTQLPEDSRFCCKCGRALAAAGRKSKITLLWILLAILALLLWYAFSGGSPLIST
jgi:predicted nucleic acid-binding Zn ribbon protein